MKSSISVTWGVIHEFQTHGGTPLMYTNVFSFIKFVSHLYVMSNVLLV